MGGTEDNIVDEGSFSPVSDDLKSRNPLDFPHYQEALATARDRSGADEAVTAGPASIGGHNAEVAFFVFPYLGGSMGEIAGERLARALERAAKRRVPFVLRTATGGARMQEGMRSLIQMSKTVAARAALAEVHRPFVAILGHPTTGGVLASLAALADVTVAEAEATIGFAGPRVAERVTGRSVGHGSHSATTAFNHGLVDEMVPTGDVRAYLVRALDVLAADEPEPVEEPSGTTTGGATDPWEAVQRARSKDRLTGDDLVRGFGDLVLELRGDRGGRDDPALTTAVVRLQGRRALMLALNRTHAPGPAAYRKARRAITVAERLALPIVTLVDTRGADPSSDSENAGIAWEIGATFETMMQTDVPTIAVVTGEGGSGGALAFATVDELLAYDDSVFSVIGPEGAAEILWKDADRAPDAARALKLTASDLLALGIADALIPGPPEPGSLASVVAYHLDRLADADSKQRLQRRRDRWRDRS